MTPEARLAIEIMHECGYTPHEIASDGGWIEPPMLGDVTNILGISKTRNPGKRCNNVYVEVNGQKRTLAQWSRRTGIDYDTLHSRWKRGWSPEQIIYTKPRFKETP